MTLIVSGKQHNRLHERRKYVKLHKECFCIKDAPGESLDKREIYVLSFEDLRLKE